MGVFFFLFFLFWGGGGGGGALIIGCFFLFVCFVLEGFIFRGGKKCTFSTLSDSLFSFSVFLLNFLSVL